VYGMMYSIILYYIVYGMMYSIILYYIVYGMMYNIILYYIVYGMMCCADIYFVLHISHLFQYSFQYQFRVVLQFFFSNKHSYMLSSTCNLRARMQGFSNLE